MTSNTDAIPITLDGIGKQYGDVTAVTDLDMAIQPGEFLVIVGPSGCGKSTTLRMIAGLEGITTGGLRFDGAVMNDVEPKDRNVAMVFQNYALYPHMSVARNMSFGMKSAGDYTQEEIDQRVEDAAETLGISAYLDRKPNQLSGGERQRVAIGRALVRDPDVLLLDEPLSNLDAKLRVEMRSELAALHDKVQTTSVYVTHDQTEAMTLGDRVAVLNEGELQQIDPPQELYDRPTNKFVGEFIGSPQMDFFSVEVRTATAQPLVTGETGEATSFEIALSGAQTQQIESGRYTLGVRPEDLYPIEAFDHRPEEPITLDVDMTEPLGDVKLVYGMLAGQEIIVQVDPHYDVEKGERMELVADPDKLHLFDRQTGDCIYHSYDVTKEQVEQGSQS
jgi:multiple sugar transport system ATP-binding protein